MITIVSKGNGKNFYGFFEWKETPEEVLKVRGCFYLAKVKHNVLTPVGNALSKDTFTIVEKSDEGEF